MLPKRAACLVFGAQLSASLHQVLTGRFFEFERFNQPLNVNRARRN
jgi:hypothetical protein